MFRTKRKEQFHAVSNAEKRSLEEAGDELYSNPFYPSGNALRGQRNLQCDHGDERFGTTAERCPISIRMM